ncbi:hypothetical protein BX600DRAFT_469179 [Xylariales sp. PMI_506]|nr:hypothetical protein BX600DRAFT_469179 [Xylariales sp. PMI_506]
MHLLAFSTALLLLPVYAAAANFAFTSPTASTNVNLSAPVDITWDAGSDGTTYSQVDITWTGQSTDGALVTYALVEDLTLSAGSYVWQPANVTTALAATQLRLASGQDSYFTADMHNANSSAGASVNSDKFAVTGYELIGSFAVATRPQMKWIVSAAGLLSLGLCVV